VKLLVVGNPYSDLICVFFISRCLEDVLTYGIMPNLTGAPAMYSFQTKRVLSTYGRLCVALPFAMSKSVSSFANLSFQKYRLKYCVSMTE